MRCKFFCWLALLWSDNFFFFFNIVLSLNEIAVKFGIIKHFISKLNCLLLKLFWCSPIIIVIFKLSFLLFELIDFIAFQSESCPYWGTSTLCMEPCYVYLIVHSYFAGSERKPPDKQTWQKLSRLWRLSKFYDSEVITERLTYLQKKTMK